MDLPKTLKTKLNSIISYLTGKKVIVAFSGGVDSSLLAFISSKYAKETLLVTEKSILYPEDEIKKASEFAKKYGILHEIIQRNPLDDEQFACNPEDRCYICKTGLYNDIIEIKESKNYDEILDGSNADDLDDYRPGMRALKELDITTLYVKFNIDKLEIRKLAQYFNLEVQSKPSMACFSSRIPYGQAIDEEKLYRIREGEMFLKQTFQLTQLRVRHHENKLARIELLPEDIPRILTKENLDLIKSKFKEIGFIYITIDIEGFRSGSLNEPLSFHLSEPRE